MTLFAPPNYIYIYTSITSLVVRVEEDRRVIAVICYPDGSPNRHVQQAVDTVTAEVRILLYLQVIRHAL